MHLVPLVAYCVSRDFYCLMYPLMPASLSDALLRVRDAGARDELHGALLDACTRVQIAADAASALEYLHARAGLLHRDVKAANILLDDRARARLSDVGLARSIEAPGCPGASRAWESAFSSFNL